MVEDSKGLVWAKGISYGRGWANRVPLTRAWSQSTVSKMGRGENQDPQSRESSHQRLIQKPSNRRIRELRVENMPGVVIGTIHGTGALANRTDSWAGRSPKTGPVSWCLPHFYSCCTAYIATNITRTPLYFRLMHILLPLKKIVHLHNLITKKI